MAEDNVASDEPRGKLCNGCGRILLLTLEFFYRRPDRRNAFQSRCKTCQGAKRHRLYHANAERERAKARSRYAAGDKERHRAKRRRYAEENPDKVRELSRRWAARNPGKARAAIRNWHKRNAARFAEYHRNWVKQNPEKVRAGYRAYRRRHPEKLRAYERQRRERRKSIPVERLHMRVSRAIRMALRDGEGKGGRRWQELVGYTRAELIHHIERQFTRGMSWERYLAGEVHIDHIRPRHSFAFQSASDQDFKDCWALSNLRPLWAIDNMRKNGLRTHLL